MDYGTISTKNIVNYLDKANFVKISSFEFLIFIST